MLRAPLRQRALVLVAIAVLALAFVRVATRRLGADRRAPWTEEPGVPVELAGDGVFFLSGRPTVRDTLSRAGHPCAGEAAPSALEAGDRVEVGIGCRARISRMPAAARLTLGLRLDVDREDANGIAALPGIGRRLAERIVADRRANGRFGGLPGLLRVRGVGQRTLEAIRPFVQSESVRESLKSTVRYTGSSDRRDSGAW